DADAGLGITADSFGNVYVTGYTFSLNFPTKNAFQDIIRGPQNAFIAKLNTTLSGVSSLAYSTYFGTGFTTGCCIAADPTGNAYVAGDTSGGISFPIKNAFQNAYGGGNRDTFIAKLKTVT